ncbi:MAG TPA: FtsW/RodA/SpoVE family cell cycle protein [Vicinamibacterales bacterium]|nr:FtsW/RodA/SpoVE family cell cycle protein [Vicinamibacterales bacterium]
MFAIALSLAGGRAAEAFADRSGIGTLSQPVDLNAITSAADLLPLLAPALPDATQRRGTATQLYQFILSQREPASALGLRRGRPLPNVGALLDAKDATTGRSVLTRGELAIIKPLAIVRTAEAYQQLVVRWGAIYLASVWFVVLFWWTVGMRGDVQLLAAAHLLTALSFAALVSRQDPLRDTTLFVRHTQLTAAGLLCFALVSAIDLRRLACASFSYLPLAGALALSIALIVLGAGPTGSNAKVNLGPLQPVEFIRLLLALFLAGYFAKRWDLLRQIRGRRVRAFDVPSWMDVPRAEYVLPVLGGVTIALLFFFLQRDLGPALFLSCVFLLTYALARNRAGLAIAGFALLIAGFYIGYALNISSTLTSRVAMWQSLWDNGARGGEQIAQAIWGLATGGVFGTGLGLGDTSYVPAGYTDLMLAAIGEELGFVGLLAVAALFAIITARGFEIARRAPDDYTFFLASVITLFVTLPVLVMGAGTLGLVPLTGVVTPFLSFGGSAMVANFVALGLLTAIRSRTLAGGHGLLDVPSRDVTDPFRAGVARIVTGFSAAAVIILIALFDVQVVRADTFVARPHLGVQADGVRRYQYNERLTGVLATIPRGTVFDRRGLPLATGDHAVASRARDAYKKAGVEIAGCVTGPPKGGHYSADVVSGFGRANERCYPLGGAAFHVLGDVRDARNWAATNTAYVERDAQDHLRGFDDHSIPVKLPDASGHPVQTTRRDFHELVPLLRHRYSPNHAEVNAFLNRTRDVRLTIDAPLQASVAHILSKYAARSASGHAAAVVLDPDTGELLAVASYPFPSATVAARHRSTDETETLIDRARFGLYPPGSTFKLVTATAALRQNPAFRDSTFMCSLQANGRVGAQVAGTLVRDDVLDAHPHGRIDMHEGLVHSCNAYFAQLALRVGPAPLLDTANLLGISVARDDSVARLRTTLPQAGYGQGDVVASPLRMARVAAAIASNGVLREVSIEKTEKARASAAHVLVSPDAAATLGHYMRDAVLTGTGRSLREHPWRIAGKTGTAEVHGAQSHAWFIGYAPYGAADKRVAFAVLIENAGYGGGAAAPAAGEIVTAAAASGLIR